MDENDVTIELIGRSYEKLFWRSIHRKKAHNRTWLRAFLLMKMGCDYNVAEDGFKTRCESSQRRRNGRKVYRSQFRVVSKNWYYVKKIDT